MGFLSKIQSDFLKYSALRIPKEIEDVIKNGKYIMIGGNVVGQYTEPRTTQDIDLIADDATFKKVRKRLDDLNIKYNYIGSGLRAEINLDVLKASSHSVWQKALNDRVNKDEFYIPTLEGMIALKYVSIISPYREKKRKYQDVYDFVNLIPKANRNKIFEYIRLLGKNEVQLFKEDFLDKYDAGEQIVIPNSYWDNSKKEKQ